MYLGRYTFHRCFASLWIGDTTFFTVDNTFAFLFGAFRSFECLKNLRRIVFVAGGANRSLFNKVVHVDTQPSLTCNQSTSRFQ